MTIKTVETENEGLKRAFMLTIPAQDIEARVEEEVKRIAPQVRMPGFRPGKVPPNLIRKMHGDALRRDALDGAVRTASSSCWPSRTSARRSSRRSSSTQQYEPGKDAEVQVQVEALPECPDAADRQVTLERLTVEPDEKARRRAAPAACQPEQALVGRAQEACRRDRRPRRHGFRGQGRRQAVRGRQGRGHVDRARLGPADPRLRGPAGRRQGRRQARSEADLSRPIIRPANLAGKDATFAVEVKGVKIAGETKLDDEFAKSLGLQTSTSSRA